MIAALQGHGATPESPSVKVQFNVIKDILDREQFNTYSWWQLVTGRGPSGVLRRMILGAWMQAMNQVSSIEHSRTARQASLIGLHVRPKLTHIRTGIGFWDQRHELLHELYLHQRSRYHSYSFQDLGCLWIGRLPYFCLPSLLCHREIWPEEGHDVFCCCLRNVLVLHCHRYWSQSTWG